jgi:beta-lactam-binding protein with PASTA domain
MFLSNAVKFVNTKKLRANAAARTTGYVGTLHLVLTVLLSFFLFSTNANAIDQTPWTSQFGSAVDDYADDIVIDTAGNSYVTGYTMGDLGGPSQGSADLFVAKIDPAGNVLWVVHEGTAEFDRGTNIALDSANNVYVTGYSRGSLVGVNPGAGATFDYFIIKYDTDGNRLWGNSYGGDDSQLGFGINVAPNGDIYACGEQYQFIPNAAVTYYAFVTKYDSTGTQQWTDVIGTPTVGAGGNQADEYCTDVAVGADGFIYITGGAGDSLTATGPGGGDIFFAKYNSAGSQQWLMETGTPGWDRPGKIAVDASGNSYVSANTSDTFTGDINDLSDMITVKVNTNGVSQWVRQIGTSTYDSGFGVGVDNNGVVYAVGQYGVGSNIVLVEYDSNGNQLSLDTMSSGNGDSASAIAVDSAGTNYFIVGDTSGNFDGQTNAGVGADVFVTHNNPTAVPGAEIVTVPSVVGLSQADATTAIEAVGLVVAIVESFDPAVPLGNVISQDPIADASATQGSTVTLAISLGPQPVTVTAPDVVGLSETAAIAEIEGAGLVASVNLANDPDVPEGDVISQTPAGGTTVDTGSTITITVSIGPEPQLTIVPDVTNTPLADAEAAIGDLLVVGTITEEYSPAFPVIPAGNVISTNPSGGALVNVGTTVDIVVSLGLAPIATPDVLGLPQADAEAAIVAADLVVGTVTLFPSDTVPAGNVISQTPLAGFPVVAGTVVDLTVSSGPALVTVPSVVGRSYSTAVAAIENAGLVVGNVSTVFTRRSCGRVRSQSPNAGTTVAAGTAVDLVVTRTRFCNPL